MSNQSEADPEDDVGPREGDIVAGKYRVERVLGRGGMGVVVAAEHTALRQKVAIKLLLPDAAKREDATERFLREARASVAIQSEHVARVMDVGTLDTGEPFMVMELLRGADLGAVIQQRGSLPPSEAVDYILQACEAIAEAHALGIIHRDLKPANLFLTTRADGSSVIKVLDFGLSKVTRPDAFEASLTQANVVMGSPFYMSPEQIRSLKGLTTRSDIWSIGVILYQLLAGTRPFDAESLADLFLKIGAEPAPPLTQHRADLPPDLVAAIHRCLEKDPAKRPQTVAELARSLAPFGGEYSRVSVERIHRVLSDDSISGKKSPITHSSSSPGDLSTTVPLPDVDDNAATVALNAADLPPYLPPEKPNEKVSSGSMAALAAPVTPPETAAAPASAAAAPPRRSKGLVIGIAAVLAIAGIGVVAMRYRSGAPDSALAPYKPAAPPTVEPVPSVTATAAPEPTATAEPAPSAVPADTAAPGASALPTALPSATAHATATAKPHKAPLRTPAPPRKR